MKISQLITGIVLIILGIILIGISFFTTPSIVFIIYGLVILIIGFFILFNEKEDKIEQIKKRKRR